LSRSRQKKDTFLELLHPLQKSMGAYCLRMLRNPSLVEDVLQSSIGKAYAAYGQHGEVRNFKAWIFRFLTWEIFNTNRKHEPLPIGEIPIDLSAEESWALVSQETAFAALLDDPDSVLDHFDEVVALALRHLAPLERAVLLLRAIGEFSYMEIHELLSIPVGSVMGYLSRARHRLRICLADYATEHGWLGPASPSKEPEP
jgi:RNA polymerase sigma-70 factor (ECF subfamily)